MHPSSKHQSLFLTPRSPWGRLPLKRTAQHYMRASEDKKPNPNDDDIVRKPQSAQPPSEIVKTIAAPANPATADQMRQAGDAYLITPPEKGPAGKFLEHFDGAASYEGTHPGTEEPPAKEVSVRFSTQPNARQEPSNFDAPERHEGDEENWQYLNRNKRRE